MNPEVGLANFQAIESAKRILQGPDSQEKPESKSKLEKLESMLRKDTIQLTTERNSEGARTTSGNNEIRRLQAQFPEQTNFNLQKGELGDYSALVSQFNQDQYQDSTNDSFVVSTLNTRRPATKLSDDSTDGYNMLANSFRLHSDSQQAHKKARKVHRLSQQTLY